MKNLIISRIPSIKNLYYRKNQFLKIGCLNLCGTTMVIISRYKCTFLKR